MAEASLSYPIGKFSAPESYSAEIISNYISQIESLPQRLKKALEGLNDKQIDTPYRPDGWTVRQVVNHLADSHMNAFIRIKLALTEDTPIIKTYEEQLWAELPDTKNIPIQYSLAILDGLHYRWTFLLKSLTPDQLKLSFRHPVSGLNHLDRAIGLYAWHGNHHLAHITSLKTRNNW